MSTRTRVIGVLAPRALYGIPGDDVREYLKLLDRAGFDALELWGADDFAGCLNEFLTDPWERLRMIRDNIDHTPLRLTVSGQCLLGSGIYADDLVEYFVARAADNGINIICAYDALNDPRNLETVAAAAKKRNVGFEGAMIPARGPAYSVSYYAGYAALLEKLGADSVGIIDRYCVLAPGDVSDLVGALKKSVSVPVFAECGSIECISAAVEAGADMVACRLSRDSKVFAADVAGAISTGLSAAAVGRLTEYPFGEDDTMRVCVDSEMTERVRADAGYPPMAAPIDRIVYEQAELNGECGVMYERVTPGFCALVRGMYGRTPMPPSAEVTSAVGDSAPMLLARPADMLAPELDKLRAETARYLEQADDILTYAIAGDDAVRFFEYRKAKEYKLDAPNADARLGVHVI